MELFLNVLLCLSGCVLALQAAPNSSCLDDPKGQCPGAWRLVPGDKCVLVPKVKADFQKAMVKCVELGGELMKLEEMTSDARSCMLEHHPHKKYRMIWVVPSAPGRECTLHDLGPKSRNRNPACKNKRFFACQKDAMAIPEIPETVPPTIPEATRRPATTTTTPLPTTRRSPTNGVDYPTRFGEMVDTTEPRTDSHDDQFVTESTESTINVTTISGVIMPINASYINMPSDINRTRIVHFNLTDFPTAHPIEDSNRMHDKLDGYPTKDSPLSDCKSPTEPPSCPESWVAFSNSLCLYVSLETKGDHSEATYECVDKGGELLSESEVCNNTKSCLSEHHASTPSQDSTVRLAGGKCLDMTSGGISICASDRKLGYICVINHGGKTGESMMGAAPIAGISLAATTVVIVVYHTMKARMAK